jgi:hypothetical protein
VTTVSEHKTATLGLTVIDESGPEPVLHARSWPVPPGIIETLAAAMTSRYGQPDEMIADPRVLEGNGQKSAEEDGTVFLIAEASDG